MCHYMFFVVTKFTILSKYVLVVYVIVLSRIGCVTICVFVAT